MLGNQSSFFQPHRCCWSCNQHLGKNQPHLPSHLYCAHRVSIANFPLRECLQPLLSWFSNRSCTVTWRSCTTRIIWGLFCNSGWSLLPYKSLRRTFSPRSYVWKRNFCTNIQRLILKGMLFGQRVALSCPTLIIQGGSGTEPELETGTVGTVFPRNRTRNWNHGTVFQEPKPEPEPSLSVKLHCHTEKAPSPEKPPEPKTGTARTVPPPNRNPQPTVPVTGGSVPLAGLF